MAYTIETIGSVFGGARIGAVARFVPVVHLGNGAKVAPRTAWRPAESLDEARRRVIYMAQAANLAEPMWSGWVELDGPNEIPPLLRAQHPQGATAWRIW